MATNPTLLLVPIAENGTKNTLPETQATPGNGLMSQSTGFPAECSLPLGAGGVAPDRADFNGAFNLLGGVAFYSQKGWRFTWDATQDYYAGCIVIDTTDGNAYQAINDVSAGGSVPSLDTTNWILFAKQSANEQSHFTPAFNKRDIVTTSGTYTAPVSGWYKISVRGGGGGGGGGQATTNTRCGAGGGGGEGGLSIGYEYMNAGDTATVTIGAGGAGGTVNNAGQVGGTSTVSVNMNSYSGGGGTRGGSHAMGGQGGPGGTGTIPGSGGSPGNGFYASSALNCYGGLGGGENGGYGGTANSNGTASDGSAGLNGYAWFEYFDSSLNP